MKTPRDTSASGAAAAVTLRTASPDKFPARTGRPRGNARKPFPCFFRWGVSVFPGWFVSDGMIRNPRWLIRPARPSLLLPLLAVSLPPALDAATVETTLKPFDLPASSAEASFKRFAEQAGSEVLFASRLTRGVKINTQNGRWHRGGDEHAVARPFARDVNAGPGACALIRTGWRLCALLLARVTGLRSFQQQLSLS